MSLSLLRSESKTFEVKFGTAFSADQFGFVRWGTITVSNSRVKVAGRKNWSALARTSVLLAITILPWVLFGFGLGFFLAAVVIRYLCTSPGSIEWNNADSELVTRSDNKIWFWVLDHASGKPLKSLFRAADEEATELERLLAAQSRTIASPEVAKAARAVGFSRTIGAFVGYHALLFLVVSVTMIMLREVFGLKIPNTSLRVTVQLLFFLLPAIGAFFLARRR